jgi:nucleoid-associated protein YgaU
MRLARSGQALVVLALVVLVGLVPGSPALLDQLRSDDFPTVALGAGSLLLLAVSGWVVAVAAAGSLGTSSQVVRTVAPQFLRHALFVGVAGAMVAAPAHAERSGSSPVEHSVEGLPLPDRPTSGRAAQIATPAHDRAATHVRPSAASAATRRVVVRAGDTLWAIAARSLPADATTAEIAAACDRWHAANRAAIGDDPDLIFPRQRLTPPGKDQP